eukprot:scaffold12.g8166.t1
MSAAGAGIAAPEAQTNLDSFAPTPLTITNDGADQLLERAALGIATGLRGGFDLPSTAAGDLARLLPAGSRCLALALAVPLRSGLVLLFRNLLAPHEAAQILDQDAYLSRLLHGSVRPTFLRLPPGRCLPSLDLEAARQCGAAATVALPVPLSSAAPPLAALLLGLEAVPDGHAARRAVAVQLHRLGEALARHGAEELKKTSIELSRILLGHPPDSGQGAHGDGLRRDADASTDTGSCAGGDPDETSDAGSDGSSWLEQELDSEDEAPKAPAPEAAAARRTRAQQADARLPTLRAGEDCGAAALECCKMSTWTLRFRQPQMERAFLLHHSRSHAALDAASLLLFLVVAVMMGLKSDHAYPIHTATWQVANAVIFSPLPLVLVPAWRPHYIARREHLLGLFWIATLAWHSANLNFVRMGFVQRVHNTFSSSVTRFFGYGWITTLSLAIQLRFCRQLPLLALVVVVNAALVPLICTEVHASLPLHSCMASGTVRACVAAVPLLLTYALERRARRTWLQHAHAHAE